MDERQQSKIAQAVASAAREVQGVAGLHLGRNLLPSFRRDDRVPGVNVQAENGRYKVEVRLVVFYTPGRYLPALADEVREHIRKRLAEMDITHVGAVDIVLEDIVEANAAS